MGKSKTNMFEAFRVVASRSAAPPPADRAPTPPPHQPAPPLPAAPRRAAAAQDPAAAPPGEPWPSPVAGPFAQGAPPPAPPARPLAPDAPTGAQPGKGTTLPEPGGEDGPHDPYEGACVLPMGWPTFVAVQVALLAVAFYLGLVAGRETWAAEPAVPPAAAAPPAAQRPGAAAAQRPPAGSGAASRGASAPQRPDPAAQPARPAVDDPLVRAFLDEANVFTLQLVSYDDTQTGRGLAQHWLGVLREAGLPAVLRQVGGKLTLCVGASPNALAVEDLREAVRAVRDSRGQSAFPDPRVMPLRDFR